MAHASHDLPTPLASLQAMLEAVEDGLAPIDQYLPAMGEQVRHLGTLVNDLFELARIDAGSAHPRELRDVRLDLLVASCVRGVAASAEARGVRLESRVNTPPRRPPAARPSTSSGCSSTSWRTPSATRPATARSLSCWSGRRTACA